MLTPPRRDTVASLTLVSPCAVTDDITLFSPKRDEVFLVIILKSEDLFCHSHPFDHCKYTYSWSNCTNTVVIDKTIVQHLRKFPVSTGKKY